MTRIQMRRDTAANWAANNPTPFAGEPCFETDTGKLKIGDGSTAYNDLAYQGGGGSGGGAEIDDTTTSTSKVWSSSKTNSEIQTVAGEVVDIQGDVASLDADVSTLKTSKQDKLVAGENITIDTDTNTISATGSLTPTNMVTTDTEQPITGLKTFIPASSASYGVKEALRIGSMRLGTDSASSPNPVISGENIKIVNSAGSQIAAFSSSESIALGNGTEAMSLNCLANTVNLKAGSSINYVGNLQIGTKTLKYTSVTGDTTDLLAGGSGATIDDTTTSADSVWSSDKVNTELGKKQDTLPTNEAGYQININGTSVAGSTVYFGGNTSSSLAPNAKADTTNHILNINGYGVGGSGITMYDTVLKTNSFKYGDRTNQYEVVNKSPDNNTYMAHMAMPSDKYIDLELGASGTEYTAPADGWIYLRRYASASNTITTAYFSILLDAYAYEQRAQQLNWAANTNGQVSILLPISKNQTYKVSYRDFNALTESSCFFRFIYAAGSKPTA